MQPMPRFETTAPTRLHALISDLRWRVQLLDADIEEQERKSRVFEPASHSRADASFENSPANVKRRFKRSIPLPPINPFRPALALLRSV